MTETALHNESTVKKSKRFRPRKLLKQLSSRSVKKIPVETPTVSPTPSENGYVPPSPSILLTKPLQDSTHRKGILRNPTPSQIYSDQVRDDIFITESVSKEDLPLWIPIAALDIRLSDSTKEETPSLSAPVPLRRVLTIESSGGDVEVEILDDIVDDEEGSKGEIEILPSISEERQPSACTSTPLMTTAKAPSLEVVADTMPLTESASTSPTVEPVVAPPPCLEDVRDAPVVDEVPPAQQVRIPPGIQKQLNAANEGKEPSSFVNWWSTMRGTPTGSNVMAKDGNTEHATKKEWRHATILALQSWNEPTPKVDTRVFPPCMVRTPAVDEKALATICSF